jgi:hypothetical protein
MKYEYFDCGSAFVRKRKYFIIIFRTEKPKKYFFLEKFVNKISSQMGKMGKGTFTTQP